jgi:S1-C subfamily serine protease
MDSHDLIHSRSESAVIEGLSDAIRCPGEIVDMLRDIIPDRDSSGLNNLMSSRMLRSAGVHLSWETTMEAAIQAILSIRVVQIASFDGEYASVSSATGFVVDKEEGLVLTNRHVVSAGPVVARVYDISNAFLIFV